MDIKLIFWTSPWGEMKWNEKHLFPTNIAKKNIQIYTNTVLHAFTLFTFTQMGKKGTCPFHISQLNQKLAANCLRQKCAYRYLSVIKLGTVFDVYLMNKRNITVFER
jgi:hypothetical protein